MHYSRVHYFTSYGIMIISIYLICSAVSSWVFCKRACIPSMTSTSYIKINFKMTIWEVASCNDNWSLDNACLLYTCLQWAPFLPPLSLTAMWYYNINILSCALPSIVVTPAFLMSLLYRKYIIKCLNKRQSVHISILSMVHSMLENKYHLLSCASIITC